MATPIIKGETARYETEGLTFQKDSVEQTTFKYVGEYEELKSSAPKKGDSWESLTVTRVTIVRGEDGVMGEMSVTCTSGETGPADGAAAEFEHIEFEPVETRQPIEMHPDFLQFVQGGVEGVTIKAWLKFKESPLALRLEKKYLDDPNDTDSDVKSLPNTLSDWADLFNRGITDYVTYLPVVTRQGQYKAQPLNMCKDLGKKDSPPGEVTVPSAYSDGEWLKTCDKAVYDSSSGHWTRTEQWTYAAEWPTLLYGS